LRLTDLDIDGKMSFYFFTELEYMCKNVDGSQIERYSIQGAVVKQA